MPRPQVVRTCVGCRQRTAKSELLRVVLTRSGASLLAAPDPDGRAPGRGAHLHPTSSCLARAERRRAFARALRAEGSVDVSPVRRYVERISDAADEAEHRFASTAAPTKQGQARQRETKRATERQEEGRAAHELSMRTER